MILGAPPTSSRFLVIFPYGCCFSSGRASLFTETSGTSGKGSPVVNLSEDIFAGYNVHMREEASPHVDALEFEKGREAGFLLWRWTVYALVNNGGSDKFGAFWGIFILITKWRAAWSYLEFPNYLIVVALEN